MLCTRIRLVERRYSMARETPQGVPATANILPGSSISSATSSRIIQRPCVMRNLSSNCVNSIITTSTTTTTETTATAGGNSRLTPRQIIDQSLLKKNTRKKPPLIIFSLGMQPDVKTLAQHNVKRDPRKLPTFCENYKQITKRSRKIASAVLNDQDQNSNENQLKNDLFIRGVEIFHDQQQKSQSPLENNPENGDSVYMPSELQIRLTDCCECIREIYAKHYLENMQIMSDENEIDCETTKSNFLTIKGHSSSAPVAIAATAAVMEQLKQLNKTEVWVKEHQRNPSPRTRQVINITVNNKAK